MAGEFQAIPRRFCGSQELTLFCEGEAGVARKDDPRKVMLLVGGAWGPGLGPCHFGTLSSPLESWVSVKLFSLTVGKVGIWEQE